MGVNMNRNFVATRIAEMISSQLNISIDEISNSDRIYHDLKISGDDASDLLEKIVQEFGISFNNFDVDKRFPTEGNESSALFWFRKILRRGDIFVETTFDDLVDYVANNINAVRGNL